VQFDHSSNRFVPFSHITGFGTGTRQPLRAPETVSELIAYHRKHELVPERKAFGTIESTGHYLKRHIKANFGSKRLLEIWTIDVEMWLHALNYAPGTRSKIRNIMSALFNHAMRYEWMDRNPITKVGHRPSACARPMSLRPPSSQLCFPS